MSEFQIVQFSQTTTLTLPISGGRQGSHQGGQQGGHQRGHLNKLTCFDPLVPLPTLAAPPQFADSPPDEVSLVSDFFSSNCQWTFPLIFVHVLILSLTLFPFNTLSTYL